MARDKLNDLDVPLGFLYGFGRSLGCLDRVVRSLSGLGLGIGFLNGALLLEPGSRACAPFRILQLRLLIQCLEIGAVGGALRFQCSGIGFILQCSVGGIQCPNPPSALLMTSWETDAETLSSASSCSSRWDTAETAFSGDAAAT